VTLRTRERPEPAGIFRIINVEFVICIVVVTAKAPTRAEVDNDAQVKPVPCTVTEPDGDRTRGETEVMVKFCPKQCTSKQERISRVDLTIILFGSKNEFNYK
jgi:hypothetical protein